MSRHFLAHREKPTAFFVVGFDRPLQAFFLQVWDSKDDDCPTYADDFFDLDLLEDIGATIPEGLRDTLVKECLGERDPNSCHDWRDGPLTDVQREPPGEAEAHA